MAACGHVGQVQRLRRLVGRGPVGGELDQLLHQVGQLPALEVEVAEDLGPLRLRQVGRSLEQLDVGAQRGQRGAQLVAGVHHQPLLLLPRGRQRAHHRVQAPGEAPDLAGAVGGQRRGQVVGRRDVLGGGAQPVHWLHDPSGQEPSQGCGPGHTGQRQQRQPEPEPFERGLLLGEVPTDLQRGVVEPNRK